MATCKEAGKAKNKEKNEDLDWKSSVQSLCSDRFVKIYVGETTSYSQPYLVPQSQLEATSEFFSKALQENGFKEGRTGVLRFPEDNCDAWNVLLFWISHKKIPYDAVMVDSLLAVRCWIVGDKYDVKDFQDEIMLALLHFCASDLIDTRSMQEAVECSGKDSKLGILILEELVFRIMDPNFNFEEEMEDSPWLLGLVGDCVREAARQAQVELPFQRLRVDGQGHAVWEDYMIGSGPKRHPFVGDAMGNN